MSGGTESLSLKALVVYATATESMCPYFESITQGLVSWDVYI